MHVPAELLSDNDLKAHLKGIAVPMGPRIRIQRAIRQAAGSGGHGDRINVAQSRMRTDEQIDEQLSSHGSQEGENDMVASVPGPPSLPPLVRLRPPIRHRDHTPVRQVSAPTEPQVAPPDSETGGMQLGQIKRLSVPPLEWDRYRWSLFWSGSAWSSTSRSSRPRACRN